MRDRGTGCRMNRPKVYIETSIPSFYHEIRTEPDMVARKQWTRQWWDERRWEYEVVTSEAVLEELEEGEYPGKQEALAMLEPIRLVRIEEAITEIVATYLERKLMPRDPTGDALHLALASYHKCDMLLTWNCRHLANANKFQHIRRVNTMLACTCQHW
jgi:predicted nucleic acid-binding protein